MGNNSAAAQIELRAPPVLYQWYGRLQAEEQGGGIATGTTDHQTIRVRYRIHPSKSPMKVQTLTSSRLLTETVSVSTLRFRYWRDGTISPNSLLWYKQCRPRDQRSMANTSAIKITATAPAEAPGLYAGSRSTSGETE